MRHVGARSAGILGLMALVLAGCGSTKGSLGRFSGNLFGGDSPKIVVDEGAIPENATAGSPPPAAALIREAPARRGLFGGRRDSAEAVQVNRYLWAAALDVLGYLPIRRADPAAGLIETDFAVPPGGRQAVQVTVRIRGAALEAGNLQLELRGRGGALPAARRRALEDAIFARARQLRRAAG